MADLDVVHRFTLPELLQIQLSKELIDSAVIENPAIDLSFLGELKEQLKLIRIGNVPPVSHQHIKQHRVHFQ